MKLFEVLTVFIMFSGFTMFFFGMHNIDLAVNMGNHIDIGLFGTANFNQVDLYLKGVQQMYISLLLFSLSYLLLLGYKSLSNRKYK